jgi:hypothetical protein
VPNGVVVVCLAQLHALDCYLLCTTCCSVEQIKFMSTQNNKLVMSRTENSLGIPKSLLLCWNILLFKGVLNAWLRLGV